MRACGGLDGERQDPPGLSAQAGKTKVLLRQESLPAKWLSLGPRDARAVRAIRRRRKGANRPRCCGRAEPEVLAARLRRELERVGAGQPERPSLGGSLAKWLSLGPGEVAARRRSPARRGPGAAHRSARPSAEESHRGSGRLRRPAGSCVFPAYLLPPLSICSLLPLRLHRGRH